MCKLSTVSLSHLSADYVSGEAGAGAKMRDRE